MKKIIVLILLVALGPVVGFAQLPKSPKDISPLLVGEELPSVNLKTPEGELITTAEIFSEKPAVVLIYRGGWCPYCNAHLSELQEAELEILKKGYQLVAISPDIPANLKVTSEKNELNYQLYSDEKGEFITKAGIAFQAPGNYKGMLLKKSDGQNDGFLPVPSVFVVDRSGKILFEHINPDYKTRLSANLLLSVLDGIQAI